MATARICDCFISHASEDKEAVARPLALALKERGYEVWFDEFELEIGDNLPEKIDEGLSISRFGVVVLSERFFEKKWSRAELNGLMAKQVIGSERVILPVWHGIDIDYLEEVSPLLASILGVPSDPIGDAVNSIAKRIDRRRDRGSSGAALIAAQESKPAPSESDPERLIKEKRRVKLEYNNDERLAFEASGGSSDGPGWLSVIVGPVNLKDDMILAPEVTPEQLSGIAVQEQWYSEVLMNRRGLRADLDGFYARFPERGEGPPGYWLRLWQDGLMEFGEAIALYPADDRRLPYVTLAEWIHDYILLFTTILKEVGYQGEVVAMAVLGNIKGFGLGLPPYAYFPEYRPISKEQIMSRPLRAPIDEISSGLGPWLKRSMDRIFVAAGISSGAFFIENEGLVEPRR